MLGGHASMLGGHVSCPVHTIPRQDVNRKKFAHIWRIRALRSVEGGCGRHRKSYKSVLRYFENSPVDS